MRTSEKFSTIYNRAIWFINFHNKDVWIVPTKDDYILSVVKPEPYELPYGTAATLVGHPIKDGFCTTKDTVDSKSEILFKGVQG